MGARLLGKWLRKPLLDCDRIRIRLDAVDELVEQASLRMDLRKILKNLRENQFKPFFHQKVPTNDGGISLGQAVIAARSFQDVCSYPR